MEIRPFAKAREFVHGLNLKSSTEWHTFSKSGKRPPDIPSSPDKVYKDEWKGWGDWLGTGIISNSDRIFMSFEEAREIIRLKKLKSQREYRLYCRSARRPVDIPANPPRTYKQDWKGWGDFLGTGRIADQNKQYRSFKEAKAFVHSLALRSEHEWREYCKSAKKPDDIPAKPDNTYKDQWKGMGDWLGTNFIAFRNRQYRSFEEAKAFVHKLRLMSSKEWQKYCDRGSKPDDIPADPASFYKDQWRGMGGWLGTNFIATYNRQYRSFEEAKAFVHSLALKNSAEWTKYSKSTGNKPDDIPASPSAVYKDQWKSWGDWLGTSTVAWQDRVYRSFEEAKRYIHKFQFSNRENYAKWCKSGNKPDDIPASPSAVYKDQWKSWGDWLGTDYIIPANSRYRPFEEAREYIHTLHLTKRDEWLEYCRSDKKPIDIPRNPIAVYEDKWISWLDWLGYKKFRDFEEAKKYIHSLALKTYSQWQAYCRSGKKPDDIPSTPNQVYKTEWKAWGDWLGAYNVAPKDRSIRPWFQAREYIRGQRLKNVREWQAYCRSGKKPDDIPHNPDTVYKKEWKGYRDFLGNEKPQYRPWPEARDFVRKLGISSQDEWNSYCKAGKLPADIPKSPDDFYKKEWSGLKDWLGYDYRPWPEAREWIQKQGLKSQKEFKNYCKTGRLPADIPRRPEAVYKDEWKSWGDFLGTGRIADQETGWSISKIKELLRHLIEGKVIYEWDEALLYSLLLRRGLLNLDHKNQHFGFFKNLIEASRTEEGRKAIEEYANSGSGDPPDLSKLSSISEDIEQEIQSASSQELSKVVEDQEPLDYGEIETAEQILAHTNVLESINVDEEAMQFYLHYSIDKLWKKAFRDKEKTVAVVKNEGKNGNKFHDAVMQTFLSDYEGTQSIKAPDGYAFPKDPTLMQLYVAFKVKTLPFFGNFSGTGAGKTLFAVLASRVIGSKMTLIVCPNDIVEQWAKNIVEIFPNSKVVMGKEAFYAKYDESKYQYLVLNYDKFSQEESPNLILRLVKERVDFIILDEIHFVKKRDEDASQRRINLDGLMTAARKKNKRVKVLGLSATPVVNNLMEGRSLLELITGKIYEDIATRSTIPNAVTLYEKLSTISIRELPDYGTETLTQDIRVEAKNLKILA